VGGIWGQTQSFADRTLDPPDLSKRRASGRGWLRRPGRDMGTDTGFLLVADMGTDTVFWRPEQIEGQARCPIYRSGTFNVQRSTLSFQRGDRKGAWRAEYGDRHRVSPTGPLTRRTCQSAGRAVEAGCGAWIWGQTRYFGAGGNRGTGTMSDIPIRNVQRATFNSQLSTV